MKRLLLILLLPVSVFAREVPDSVVKRMQKQKEFAYANDPSYWTATKPRQPSAVDNFFDFMITSPVMKWVAYGIVALIVLIIIYQVVLVNQFSFFKRTAKKKKGDAIAGEQLSLDDIEQKLRDAIANNEYRPAVRFLYLKTLHSLNEKNFIRLHAKSTNNEYLQQLRGSPKYNDFAQLTRIYEYVWYGEFEPGNHQFSKIHNSFNQFISAN